jgi:hypothetical protein
MLTSEVICGYLLKFVLRRSKISNANLGKKVLANVSFLSYNNTRKSIPANWMRGTKYWGDEGG